MKIENKSGDSLLPCETPAFIVDQLEYESSYTSVVITQVASKPVSHLRIYVKNT